MEPSEIIIIGARQHNLKNVSLRIPRNKLVVVTGLSGSGKSSLVFDTLFAEGQRRYMESLSAYARQFLDRMQKPEVDRIEGLSPAIAIEQRTSASNPRSTIATTTEIFDFLRLLFSSIGQAHNPRTGDPLRRLTPQEIVDTILAHPSATRLVILAPLIRNEKGEFRDVIEKLKREGFVRARVDGEMMEVESITRLDKNKHHSIEAVVDRLIVGDEIRSRLTDSVELALRQSLGMVLVLIRTPDEKPDQWTEKRFSTHYFDFQTGESFGELTPRHFSFNNPLGACPRCHGLGTMLVLDEGLVVNDPSRSLDGGAVVPWRRGNRRLVAYYKSILRTVARHYDAPVDKPWGELDESFKKVILYGSGEEEIAFTHTRDGKKHTLQKPFEGVMPQMNRLHSETDSEFTRKKIETFMSRQPCSICKGARFKPEIQAVTIGGGYLPPINKNSKKKDLSKEPVGKNINQICEFSVEEALRYFEKLTLTSSQRQIVAEVLKEIIKRLIFLKDVGLGYLSLNRESGTLSGGEAQRIRLATQIGSGLTAVLYILDEPSIGLHQRDNARLLKTLYQLRDLGNSVIVVEHDEETIRSADHIIDLGPGAGVHGGEIVAQGNIEDILRSETSLTGQYLNGRRSISIPRKRVSGTGAWLTIKGARENNLKNINVEIPLGTLTCITGISGSGKSTLINDILARALFRHFYGSKERPGQHEAILGLEELDKVIEIDQSSLGRTPRSNPVTYTGAFTHIRDLFSGLPAARVRGYGPGRFSFNVKGGRCETCHGDGTITIPMHFLPNVHVICEACGGKRFNRDTLEITYRGKNINDVLEMTIDEALDFFRNIPQVKDRIQMLHQVGLGYLKLGQSADTLSGGEAQRVKLAAELAKKQTGRTLYLLDEPTTGLHFADVEILIGVLLKLRESGNTLVVIEHNLDVIKSADYVIDLGPEGGSAGGNVIVAGTPEKVIQSSQSITGQYLAKVMVKK